MAETTLSFGTRLWFAWQCLFLVLFDGAFAARVWEVREPPPRALPPGKKKKVRQRLRDEEDEDDEIEERPRKLKGRPRDEDARPRKLKSRARDEDEDEDEIEARPRRLEGKKGKKALPAPEPVPRKRLPPPAEPAVTKKKGAKTEPAKKAEPPKGRAVLVKKLPEPAAPAPKTEAPKAPELPAHTPALQLLALLQREGRLIDFLEQEIASFSDAEIGAATRVVHEGCRRALHDHAKIEPVRSEEEDQAVTLADGFNPAEVKLTGNVSGKGPYKGVLRHRGWRAREVKLPVPAPGHDPTILAPAEVEL